MYIENTIAGRIKHLPSRMYLPSALSLLVLAASASAQDTPQLTLAEDDSWNKSAVLGIPSVVTAGDETVWHMNISNSPKGSFTHHQKMSIYLRSFSRPETADDPTSGWPDLYCTLPLSTISHPWY